MNNPIVLQQSNYSCGAAATAAVLRYFGLRKGGEKGLRKALKTTKDGTKITNIVRVLRSYGLTATSETSATTKDLQRLADGCLAIAAVQTGDEPGCDNGHYVVVLAVAGDEVVFMDPLYKKLRKLPCSVFQRRWRDVGTGRTCVRGQVIWISQARHNPDNRLRQLERIFQQEPSIENQIKYWRALLQAGMLPEPNITRDRVGPLNGWAVKIDGIAATVVLYFEAKGSLPADVRYIPPEPDGPKETQVVRAATEKDIRKAIMQMLDDFEACYRA